MIYKPSNTTYDTLYIGMQLYEWSTWSWALPGDWAFYWGHECAQTMTQFIKCAQNCLSWPKWLGCLRDRVHINNRQLSSSWSKTMIYRVFYSERLVWLLFNVSLSILSPLLQFLWSVTNKNSNNAAIRHMSHSKNNSLSILASLPCTTGNIQFTWCDHWHK